MKKILLVTAITIFIICLGITASAEGDFLMRIDTVTVSQGYDGEVVVPVYIDSMPDGIQLSCFAWEFYFDSDNLSFIKSMEAADFAGELIVNPDDCIIGKYDKIDGTNGKFRFAWTATDNYITSTGTALNLKFYVHSGMAPGVYNIVADPFGDIRSGTESIIYTDDIYRDINSYIIFGAIVIEGEETDYNDYEIVSAKAKYPSYIVEDDVTSSGIVDSVNGNPVDKENITPPTNTSTDTSSTDNSSNGTSNNPTVPSGPGTGVIMSSDYESPHVNDYTNEVQTIADNYDAGTMIEFRDSYIIFDTLKARGGYLLCALYKGEELVGYDISWAKPGEKSSANIYYTDIPDTAVSVIINPDGTFDCYGRYAINK